MQQIDPELEQEFDTILVYARQKFRDGVMKHGIFNPDNDSIDRIQEAIEELTDNINYSLMQITKLKRLQQILNEME